MANEQKEELDYIKMDYSLETPAERTSKVEEIIANTPEERLTPKYLERLADYIVDACAKQEKKEGKKKNLLTNNRMLTVNKRETSFEGLVGKLENGEDGIYNMIANDKNIIFAPKDPITEEDLAAIPELRELHEQILKLEEKFKTLRGKAAYNLKRQIISMRQDQYIIRSAYKKQIYSSNLLKSVSKFDLSETITIDAEGDVHSTGIINMYNDKHVSLLLNNYSKLKMDNYDKLDCDMHYMMLWLEDLIEATLRDQEPYLYNLLIYKIDGRTNAEIQQLLYADTGIMHSIEYISSLWCNKIPKLIAAAAKKEYLNWYYTIVEKGEYKKCNRCGQIKLINPFYFSKNKSSKDGFYSICKSCRNKK